jgi:hypothetical protein
MHAPATSQVLRPKRNQGNRTETSKRAKQGVLTFVFASSSDMPVSKWITRSAGTALDTAFRTNKYAKYKFWTWLHFSDGVKRL